MQFSEIWKLLSMRAGYSCQPSPEVFKTSHTSVALRAGQLSVVPTNTQVTEARMEEVSSEQLTTKAY